HLGAALPRREVGARRCHFGTRDACQVGLVLLSLWGLGEGLAVNFPSLFAARFILGIGAALFFAPAIGVLTPLFRPEEEGFVLGLYNAMFNVGGALGLFACAFLFEIWNWR